MRPVYAALEYSDAERIYKVSETLDNGLLLDIYIQLHSEKFLEYQKEILQEFVADFLDKTKDQPLTSKEIEQLLESELQKLNTKLQSFADKLRDVPKCDLRGYVQVIVDQAVKTWMIGKTTLMIFRDEKVYSVLENSYQEQTNIDQFSDFIGGEIERGDVFMYAGTKLSDILDQQDLDELQQVLSNENAAAMLDVLGDILGARVEKSQIWFLSSFSITGIDLSRTVPSKRGGKLTALASKYTSKVFWKVNLWAFNQKARQYLKGNMGYYLMAWGLGIVILFLGYAVLSQLRGGTQSVTYTTATGGTASLTLDQIKADIFAFQTLDPNSDEKSVKYNEILQKLGLLEQKGMWAEDVKNLRESLNASYEQGFNVMTIKSLSQFDDEQTGRKTWLLTFSETEKAKLWTPISVNVASQINIWGKLWALLGSVNENTRGTLVEYNVGSDAKDCSLSLSKKGLFCYTAGGELFFVSKTGIETMETTDGERSTKDIGGIGTYNKTSIYLFQHSPANFASVFLTRYINIAGSESKYKNGQNYTVLTASGASLPSQMEGFAIDGNFMARWDGALYQFWRSSNVSSRLDYRQVPIVWGDKVSSNYSNNVKVLVSSSSPYIFLFDRDNQTFTVYESSPTKVNDNYKTSFKLYYMFRFKFDLSGTNTRVVDVAVPESTNDRPELYILTTDGLNKINLYEFIDSLKAQKSLKEVTEQ